MANEILTRTPTSSGNRKVWTWSGWVKQNEIDKQYGIILSTDYNTSGDYGLHFGFNGTQPNLKFKLYANLSGSVQIDASTEEVFRDCGSWQHILIAVDTTAVTQSDRVKLYINGAQTYLSGTLPAVNIDVELNSNQKHTIGGLVVNGSLNSSFNLDSQVSDLYFIDGQALTPDVFGFYKDGDGYMSSGTTNATDFRPGQWMPHAPRVIKKSIERSGGFGVNGLYLPLNDSSNPGADFHCAPNSIITLKGEDLPQPQNGAPTTTDAYVSQLRPEKEGTLGFDGVVKFDGSTQNRLTLPVSSDFAFGTGDFTVEMFVYHTDLTGQQTYFGDTYGPTAGLYLYKTPTNQISTYDTAQRAVSGANVIKGGQWHHLSWTVSSGVLRQFVDGNKITETSYNGNYTTTEYFLGDTAGTSSGEFIGFMSNVRVIKGTALYTSNFTPPTEPLTNITNTTLLCCNSSTSAIAATVKPGDITANGNVFATRNELTGSIVLAVPGISTATGANLVTNGTFDTNTTGWTAGNSATLSVDSGRLKVTNGTSSGGWAYQEITVVIGQRYTVNLEGITGTSASNIRIGTAANSASYGNKIGSGLANISLTATSTSLYVTLKPNSNTNGNNAFFDNIVVKQEDAPTDYSADIKGSGTNKTLTANGTAGVGYELGGYYGSAMTFDGTGDDAIFVPASSDSELTGDFTIEYWAYSDGNVTYSAQLSSKNYYYGSNSGNFYLGHIQNGSFGLYSYNGTSSGVDLAYTIPTAARYDQWHHMCFEREGNTLRLYLNGVVVAIDTSWTRSLNDAANGLYIGKLSRDGGTNDYGNFDGKLQDFRIYNGLAKYKGGFDVPKPYTPVGIEAFRTTADTCKNNFATLNPLATGQNTPVYSDGNLSYSNTQGQGLATMGVSSGKMYWEVYMTNTNAGIGVAVGEVDPADYVGKNSTSWSYYISGGKYTNFNSHSNISPYGASYTAGDIIGVALDCDSGNLTFYKNGVSQGVAFTGFNDGRTYFPTVGSADGAFKLNFGQNPSFSGTVTAGTNADDSGKGLFKYAPPTGFLALCEDNLPTPAIADPGEHFKAVLYTGSGGSKAITGVGFKPDFVWLKCRNVARVHGLWDSVRGASKYLVSSGTNVEEPDTTNGVQSFDGNGFSIGSVGTFNNSGDNYVAWCWKAGGAAVSNTDGTLTSQVSVNHDAGFSIVKFTAQTSGTGTVGHGLSKKPAFWIYKPINNTTNWYMYHQSLGASAWLNFSTTQATTGNAAAWGGVEPTSTVLTHGDGLINQGSCILYAWTEVEGYSKFGSYVGNASDDGPFVYCGFKPAWVMLKVSDPTGSANSWVIYDSSRNSTNMVDNRLRADLPNIEDAHNGVDFLSNGFKLRDAGSSSTNQNGKQFIFMAFAESPFQTANAK